MEMDHNYVTVSSAVSSPMVAAAHGFASKPGDKFTKTDADLSSAGPHVCDFFAAAEKLRSRS